MRRLLTASVLVILAALPAQAQTIAFSTVPVECTAIPNPSRQDLEPWLAGSAFSNALRLHLRGSDSRATIEFENAWKKVALELSSAFATEECRYDAVNAALDRRVFKAPPDSIPMEEDFGMPPVVAMAAAHSACRAGRLELAMEWLRPAADSGIPAALAAYVVLESVSSPDVAASRITGSDRTAPETALAGCLASIRARNPSAIWCETAKRPQDGRQAMSIVELILSAGAGSREDSAK